MGCDIHAFVEYSRKDDSREKKYWYGFGEEFHLSRDYLIFGLLAGVRVDVQPIVEPRGIPEDAGYAIIERHTLYVVEDDKYHDESGNIPRSRAEKSVEKGYSKWFDKGHTRITVSDYHGHSWLTTKEYEKCISRYNSENRDEFGIDASYKAILLVMKFFESEGYTARLVFWFDN